MQLKWRWPSAWWGDSCHSVTQLKSPTAQAAGGFFYPRKLCKPLWITVEKSSPNGTSCGFAVGA